MAQRLPILPQAWVDTTMPVINGNTYAVNAGGNLHAALNQATAADPNLNHVIVLQAGATFTGPPGPYQTTVCSVCPIALPGRPASATGWIIIRSSAIANLPPEGMRVKLSDAVNMPKIVATAQSNFFPLAVYTAAGAHRYRLIGIEVRPNPGILSDLVRVEPQNNAYPHHIIFDRVYVHGDPTVGAGRGIIMEGAHIGVIDSYIADIKLQQNDSQALLSVSGSGPFKIVNNHLEASGENVMFGGGDPAIVGQVPSDIEIRGNHFFKPLSWKGTGPPSGGTWLIKNLLEFKLGERVLVDGNVFENNWYGQGQEGYGIVITPRNQNGKAPWSRVRDITFTHNIMRRSDDGIAMSGQDATPGYQTQVTERILIAHNLFENMDSFGNGRGRLFMVTNGMVDLTIEHNTAFPRKHYLIFDGGPDQVRMTYRNNLHHHGEYGLWGAGKRVALGEASLTAYAPGAVFAKNVIIGPYPTAGGVSLSFYPTFAATNFFPNSVAQVGFVNYAGGDYHLSAASPYKNGGTDAKDIGANIAAIYQATASVIPGGSRRATE